MTTGTQAPVKALLGRKLGMTQVWDEEGKLVPVTVVEVEKNVVTDIRTPERDGYTALQLGFGQLDERKVTKPMAGHFAKSGVTPRRHLAEVRTTDADSYELGQELGADLFETGALVDVTGNTKGKGFAGVMKRHGFQGVSSSHGAHRNHRKPGSIGACATPGRVFRGLNMAGRMGGERRTIMNLKVQAIDADKGLVVIAGAIPGPKGGIVMIRSAVKGD
ncbi:50S ribosomal protein L3 [Mobiluncus mulieris]|uniref:Large ribosomal subunit protein uL3 n=2 Tax=Mobiluncus mulieris TaxID=2052 RepID=E0QTQ7_9ACTO|nr:50S ribosomal protein L3 [Mobiluncus mulieris]EEZ91270.1 50S ribosomal protein L3 [Mobiluncus mulieris 28-1]EFM45101.1 50S ribosomal protein L3 [Mobiluncus mulieris ATCC 35239]MCU9968551.1 50S ribosomal protein L3 [Mobiluncus mulieris]MCU9972785.1 50S ribosomal protein L3 [Mobiluncus mulieris]MCU9975137.1 50S ribosomal protein L3 [Mobiluncus mulieris]